MSALLATVQHISSVLSTDAVRATHQPTNTTSIGMPHLPVRPGRSPLSHLQLTSSILCCCEALSMNIAAARAVAHPENIIAAENATCRLQTIKTLSSWAYWQVRQTHGAEVCRLMCGMDSVCAQTYASVLWRPADCIGMIQCGPCKPANCRDLATNAQLASVTAICAIQIVNQQDFNH